MKTHFNVQGLPLPEKSLLSKYMKNCNYFDTFGITFTYSSHLTVEDLTRRLFLDLPEWIIKLFDLRNALVKPFGLRTDDIRELLKNQKITSILPGEKFSFFDVEDKNVNEIILKGDDSHLDFKCSILLLQNGLEYSLIISTIVFFNKLLGRLYFIPVKPFHKLLIKKMLKNTVLKLYSEKLEHIESSSSIYNPGT